MSGFNYRGASTETILDVPLCIVFTEGQTDSLGMSREKVEGERTISRTITNEYGTIYNPLSFTFSLMKQDYSVFTEEEQVKIERWLTSPKLSSELQIINCEDESYSYFGIFTETRYEIVDGDLGLCTLTFNVNGAYPFKHYVVTGSPVQNIQAQNNEYTININCKSDELEEYVYPVIKVTAFDANSNSSFTLTNVTDNSNYVTVTTNRRTTIQMDCEHCIISEHGEGITQNAYINLLKYKDIGWEDIGNIYWPRLIPGENVIKIKGNVTVEFSYYVPFKKIGGWLV